VVELFRASGADVQHNTLVAGNQVDILVTERTSAGTEVRLVVECKRLAKAVGVADVNEFAGRVKLIRDAHRADIGMLVSATTFTTPAREAAATHGIRLLAVEDLEYRVDAPVALVVDDVRQAVATAERLVGDVRAAFRSPDRLSSFELEGIHNDITKALDGYRHLLERHRTPAPPSREARAALGDILRLEEATDQVLDALYYFRRVDDAISASEAELPPAGRVEADHAAANSIRLRDLEQARSQLRFRLKRLAEACARLT
jgi:hypothetical protein